jgi:hypothetical protein
MTPLRTFAGIVLHGLQRNMRRHGVTVSLSPDPTSTRRLNGTTLGLSVTSKAFSSTHSNTLDTGHDVMSLCSM